MQTNSRANYRIANELANHSRNYRPATVDSLPLLLVITFPGMTINAVMTSAAFFPSTRTWWRANYLQKRHGRPICRTLMMATGEALSEHRL